MLVIWGPDSQAKMMGCTQVLGGVTNFTSYKLRPVSTKILMPICLFI